MAIAKRDLKTFLRQISTLEEISEGSMHREDWWETTRAIGSRALYKILRRTARRYDTLTTANNKADTALREYLRREGQIRNRVTHEMKHAPKGTDLIALADGIEAEERGDSGPIEESFKEFRDKIQHV